jgi:hypothetical protein
MILPYFSMISPKENLTRQRVKPFQHRARWLEAMSDVAHQELPDASLDLVCRGGRGWFLLEELQKN